MSLRSIAIILVAASFTGANTFRINRRNSEHSDDAVQSLSSMRAEVFNLVNKERAKVGAPKLCYNTKLMKATKAHSEDQQSCGRMSHTGCDGSSVKDRLARVGYSWRAYAENVARGQSSAAAVMRSWMRSDGHRKNILNPALKNIGIGLSSKFYWTQKFGTPKSGSGCDFKSRMEQDGEVSTHDSEIGTAVFGDADSEEDKEYTQDDSEEEEQEYTDDDIAEEFAQASANGVQAVTPLASFTTYRSSTKQICTHKLKGGCTCGTSVSKLTPLAQGNCGGKPECKFVSVWPRDSSKGGGSCFRQSTNCDSMGPLTDSSGTATIFKKSR